MLTPTWPHFLDDLGRSQVEDPQPAPAMRCSGWSRWSPTHGPAPSWKWEDGVRLAPPCIFSNIVSLYSIWIHMHMYIHIIYIICVGKTKSRLAYEDYSTNPDLSLASTCLLIVKWSCAILYAVDFRENRMAMGNTWKYMETHGNTYALSIFLQHSSAHSSVIFRFCNTHCQIAIFDS